MILAELTATIPAHAGNAIPWAPALVHSVEAWSDRMNGAQVSGVDSALRIEAAPGKTWAIAAVPRVLLPAAVGEIRVRVRSVGGGGKWLVRLHGDLRGKGEDSDYGPFQGETASGLKSLEIDPRLLGLEHSPEVQVQLGLEGPPGAYVVFESLEFLPGMASRRRDGTIPGQRNIRCVDYMPDIPSPFKMLDWRARAKDYDRFVFDFNATGQFLPLIWLDNSRVNIDAPTFGLSSYVGDKRQGSSNEEGINCMGVVLGATVAGIDKSKQDHNYVLMCEAYYNSKNGSRLVLNGTNGRAGGSFWYDIWPHILFYALADRYPGVGRMEEIVKTTADRWYGACGAMGGSDTTLPNFDHTAFDFAAMQPVDNGKWKEPDSAAGIAWLEYAAWTRWKKPEYLQAADWAMRFLNERQSNPYYEVLLPWGALTCARMNAELGRQYDLDKMLNWCSGISDCRGGWGVTLGNWGGYDCDGLVGSVDNRGGYAFAMNTFAQAGALVPLVRYDPRYARAIGKWMLNLANAARFFYPGELPAGHQSSAFWKGDPQGVIAYEGLRREWEGQIPCATGDPVAMKWGPETDLGLYGSSYVGFLGGIIGRTNEEKILALDCLATDFYHQPAYPTRLCYNPYPEKRRVALPLGQGRHDLYDVVSGRFLTRGAAGTASFTLAEDRAAVIVIIPANGKVTREGPKVLVNGVVVDYGISDE